MKKGYVFLRIEVKNEDIFKQYPELSEKILAKYHGKYLFRGGKYEVLEGEWNFTRNVMLEFESVEQANKWYFSDDYQKALKIRQGSSVGDLIIIEGF